MAQTGEGQTRQHVIVRIPSDGRAPLRVVAELLVFMSFWRQAPRVLPKVHLKNNRAWKRRTLVLWWVAEGSVKTRLLRARLQMRDALAPEIDGSWNTGKMEYQKIRPRWE